MRSPVDLGDRIIDETIATLVRERGSVNDVYHRVDSADLHALFSVFVRRLRSFLHTGDEASYADFLRRWVAVRAAAGALLENLVPAIVAIGDAVAQEAFHIEGDTDDSRAISVAVARASLLGARVVNEVLAAELVDKRQQVFDVANPDEATRRE